MQLLWDRTKDILEMRDQKYNIYFQIIQIINSTFHLYWHLICELYKLTQIEYNMKDVIKISEFWLIYLGVIILRNSCISL